MSFKHNQYFYLSKILKNKLMILIADSGSTKTHWCLVDCKTIVKEIYTNGINPFYQSEADILKELESELKPQVKEEVSEVFFYGAGCSFPEKKQMVNNAIAAIFPEAKIYIYNDLLAAARALFQDKSGIACILGTGSNSCFYDGESIVANVSPLGFILGDEGSGAVLGKKFIGDLLKNQLCEDLSRKFFDEFKLTPAEIMDAVYKQPFPNRYLARFTRFMSVHKEDEGVSKIINQSFAEFFQRNVWQYNYKEHACSFVGSIAYYFKDLLVHAAAANNVQVGEVVKSPMDGLIKYHCR